MLLTNAGKEYVVRFYHLTSDKRGKIKDENNIVTEPIRLKKGQRFSMCEIFEKESMKMIGKGFAVCSVKDHFNRFHGRFLSFYRAVKSFNSDKKFIQDMIVTAFPEQK